MPQVPGVAAIHKRINSSGVRKKFAGVKRCNSYPHVQCIVKNVYLHPTAVTGTQPMGLIFLYFIFTYIFIFISYTQ